jgi:hypothetical protein
VIGAAVSYEHLDSGAFASIADFAQRMNARQSRSPDQQCGRHGAAPPANHGGRL